MSSDLELANKLLKIKTNFEKAGMKVVVKMKKVIHNVKKKNIEVYNKAIELGLNHLEATILANRINTTIDLEKYIYPRYRDIMDYNKLKDIDIARDAIIEAINNNKHTSIVTDIDCDGLSSANILTLFLRDILKYKNFSYMLSTRAEGNGINNSLRDRILAAKPDMIILADHGSSNGVNLDIISDAGIKVIVTDHHELSLETPPNKYVAFVNPQRPDCEYDKSISGCAVAYMLILSIADKLNINKFSKDMQNILSITALTIISDSMRLDSITNRALVKTGLKVINSFKTDNWKRVLIDEPGLITYKALGWRVSPLMNSASRMGVPEVGYRIFMETEDKEIRDAVSKAYLVNSDRKILQEELFRDANDEYILDRDLNHTVVSRTYKGLGIQGIVASKFVDLYKKPSVVFYYDKNSNTYKGSGRGDGEINLLDILRDIEKNNKDQFIALGGHKGAAGFTIKEEFYREFKKQFDYLVMVDNNVSEHFDPNYTKDNYVYEVDLELSSLDYGIYQSIQLLAPYGQAWSTPLFSTIFMVKRANKISRPKKNDMYVLELLDSKNIPIECVYFPNEDLDFEIREKTLLNVVYEVEYNSSKHKGISLNIKDLMEY